MHGLPLIYLTLGDLFYGLSFYLIYKKGRATNNKALSFLSFYFVVLCISPSFILISNIINESYLISLQICFVALGNTLISVGDLILNYTIDYLTRRRITRITSVLLFLFGFAFGIIISQSVALKMYHQYGIIVWGYDFQTKAGSILFLFLFLIKLIGQTRFIVYSLKIEKKEEQIAKEKIRGGALFSRWFILVFIVYLILFYFRIRELTPYGLDYMVTGFMYLLLFQFFLSKSNLYDRPPFILNHVLLSYKSGPILKLLISGSKITTIEDQDQMAADRLVLLASDIFKNFDQIFSIFGIEKHSGYVMQYLVDKWSVVFFLSRYDPFYEEKIIEFGNSITDLMKQGITANAGFMLTPELIKKIMVQMSMIV